MITGNSPVNVENKTFKKQSLNFFWTKAENTTVFILKFNFLHYVTVPELRRFF